jgi:hypothetical protein
MIILYWLWQVALMLIIIIIAAMALNLLNLRAFFAILRNEE